MGHQYFWWPSLPGPPSGTNCHYFMQGGGQPALPEPDISAVAGAGGRRQQQAPAGHRPPQQLHPLAARHALETQQS